MVLTFIIYILTVMFVDILGTQCRLNMVGSNGQYGEDTSTLPVSINIYDSFGWNTNFQSLHERKLSDKFDISPSDELFHFTLSLNLFDGDFYYWVKAKIEGLITIEPNIA